ncbi:hypothetical protein [Lichenibacterium ramalinae]|nr:hypothetical protein [Lichenibacterium ramalinae]
MSQEKRFGRRIAEPSSVQIIRELKAMALRAEPAGAAGQAGPTVGDGDPRADTVPHPSHAL